MESIKLVLVSSAGRHIYIRNTEEDYHCQYGMIKKEDMAEIKSGGSLNTNTGATLMAFPPSFLDSYKRIKRAPQIIPRKDVAAIIAETGIGKSSVIVDAGTGSGALAIFLANIAKSVVTYEIREDFTKIAEDNIATMGVKNITIKNKSVYDGIDEKNADVVTLDLPEPWKAIDSAKKALKTGGFIVSYSPTIPQAADLVKAAEKEGLLHLKTIEIIEREWELNERVIRPKSQQIGHSGFLTFVRKVSQ
ncbi:tRNA (adenine-N1)-methyltransferase [Candidatus Woesearchaeota archaeon]|nr:tRNA (adenine-N1)-methyltransferase [Candidatus Woesearchaeota archaeon]